EPEHGGGMLDEVQVGAADAAGLHLRQDLPEAGLGIRCVVPHDQLGRPAQPQSAHQPPRASPSPPVAAPFACVSSTCDVMALRMAWPAAPNSWLRFSTAHSCEARGAASCPV